MSWGLSVHPFRALRYDPMHHPDLAAVTSPPYDVIDPDAAAELGQRDPHNVVRLILPETYADAAARLDTWRADGTLVRDPEPAIYVYEQTVPSPAGVLVQRGIFASVELRDPEERVVLPHEDVMPGPVADRLELMRTTAANLEPILLVYDGGGMAAKIIADVATGTPLVQTTTDDGIGQRLWALTEARTVSTLADDLQPRQALIADGHHRYATYRRLQAEHADDGPGPWDRGLALLVDTSEFPLQLHAIHRVVRHASLDRALAAARSYCTVEPFDGSIDDALAALATETRRHAFVVTDGTSAALVCDPDTALVDASLPAEHSALWRSLDASVLDAVLLERLWDVDPVDQRVRYVHDPHAAVREAVSSSGVAVLLRPVSVADVLTVAATGERMPRKSTSFGPKPRTGLVLRRLDEQDA